MGNYTILVLDDDPGARTLLEIMLSRTGFTVKLVNDADEALEFLNESLPDLVISDISLPGMDGIEFVKLLREQERTVELPVIILSAHHDEPTINKALRAGATEFMKKPLKMDGLREKLIQLIETKN
jgi:two-component system, sensor histidine kinase and response regulator